MALNPPKNKYGVTKECRLDNGYYLTEIHNKETYKTDVSKDHTVQGMEENYFKR